MNRFLRSFGRWRCLHSGDGQQHELVALEVDEGDIVTYSLCVRAVPVEALGVGGFEKVILDLAAPESIIYQCMYRYTSWVLSEWVYVIHQFVGFEHGF